MDKLTKKKIKISETATKRYIENQRFTIQSLTEELDMKPKEIFDLFPNRKSILLFFFESRILIYRDQIKLIENYSDFSLSEKLNNLFLTLLDQFMEYREFVLEAYNQFIPKNPFSTDFERMFKDELKTIFKSDKQLSGSATLFLNRFMYGTIYYHFHTLVLFWSNDDSDKYEQSYALVDKWCSLIEELFYNKILDKGFDLGKFLFYNSPFKDLFSNFKSSGQQSQ